MKIIFITREGYRSAGARVRCYNFARMLSKQGVDTEVLSFADNLGAKEGADEFLMGISDKIKFNYLAFRKLRNEKNAIFYMQRFNYHSFAPYLLHLFRGERIVLDLDDWEMREDPKYYLGFYPSSKAHYFIKEIARRSLCCIAASRFLEEFLLGFNRRTYYIPSGVDTGIFKYSGNEDQDKIVFSWIGTFDKREHVENITFALDCFNALKDKYKNIYFEVAGDGIYQEDVATAVSRLNCQRVVLKKWISPEIIPDYLSNIHIGLFPVVKDNKFNKAKSPTKLFEYMAMRKPVVSSWVGESGRIIEDGVTGFLARSKEEFIAKMEILIQCPGIRRKIGEKAGEAVKNNYSLDVLGSQLYNILSKFDA